MPLTTNGKVDRRVAAGARPPATGTVGRVRGASKRYGTGSGRNLEDVLNLDQVGVHDNFFDLGGNSLLVVAAYRRMESLANGKCRVLDLFKYPTIRLLAEFLGHGDLSPQDADEGIRQRVLRQRASARKQASKRKREVS